MTKYGKGDVVYVEGDAGKGTLVITQTPEDDDRNIIQEGEFGAYKFITSERMSQDEVEEIDPPTEGIVGPIQPVKNIKEKIGEIELK